MRPRGFPCRLPLVVGLVGVAAGLAGGPFAVPAAGQTFTRITSGDAVNDLRYSEGALWEDIDGDGDPDLFVANIVNEDNLLFRNDGGELVLVGGDPVTMDGGFSYGGCLADFDGDGDPDLFVANGGSAQPTAGNFFYRNDGGAFTKVTSGALVTDPGGSWSSSCADWDLDGDLDVFVANYQQGNAMYRNDGGGSFVPLVLAPVTTDGGGSLGSAWSDWDSDGDPDLFVANANFGTGEVNFLYRNDQGDGFARLAGGQVATDVRNSVGASWGDTDNDGDPDLLVANYSGANNQFYRNDGGGSFTRTTNAAGLADGGSSVGGAFADWNGDGWLDLFVANDLNQDNFLYVNDGDGTFTRILTGAIVTDGGRSNGSAWADPDGDGDLDLYVTNGDQPVAQSNFLYRNDTPGAHWLHVRLVGVASNRSAIGAKVTAVATIAGSPVRQTREVSGQTGYNSQESLEVELGLGDAAVVDSLVIEWPLGQIDSYTLVPVDRRLRLVEGQSPVAVPATAADRSGISLAVPRPNPARTRTRIAFTLSRTGPVTVEVIDVTGRRVARLVSGVRPAGTHSVEWDLRVRPPGTYFVRLRAGGEEQVRRLTVLD